jgi:hypothetical protein
MSRCVRPRQEWGRGQNTRMGGSDPTAPQTRGPVPAGFGGHSRLKLMRSRSPCFGRAEGEQQKSCKTGCKTKPQGGTERTNGNHQSTTQTTEDGNDPGSSRGVGEGTARSVCRVHRLIYVIRHHRGTETSVQARRRVQSLAMPAHEQRQPREARRRRPK